MDVAYPLRTYCLKDEQLMRQAGILRGTFYFMSYYLKLKDPRWQRKRLQILERDNFTCSYCGDQESELHVHHHYYDFGKEIWDYQNEALSTLCINCHQKETINTKNIKSSLRLFKNERLRFINQILTCCTAFEEQEIKEIVKQCTIILDKKGIEWEYTNENDK